MIPNTVTDSSGARQPHPTVTGAGAQAGGSAGAHCPDPARIKAERFLYRNGYAFQANSDPQLNETIVKLDRRRNDEPPRETPPTRDDLAELALKAMGETQWLGDKAEQMIFVAIVATEHSGVLWDRSMACGIQRGVYAEQTRAGRHTQMLAGQNLETNTLVEAVADLIPKPIPPTPAVPIPCIKPTSTTTTPPVLTYVPSDEDWNKIKQAYEDGKTCTVQEAKQLGTNGQCQTKQSLSCQDKIFSSIDMPSDLGNSTQPEQILWTDLERTDVKIRMQTMFQAKCQTEQSFCSQATETGNTNADQMKNPHPQLKCEVTGVDGSNQTNWWGFLSKSQTNNQTYCQASSRNFGNSDDYQWCTGLQGKQPEYFKNTTGAFNSSKAGDIASAYKTRMCDIYDRTHPKPDHTNVLLGATSLALTMILNTIPTVRSEIENWDDNTKTCMGKAATAFRLTLAGLTLAPPAMLLAGASAPAIAAVSAGVSGGYVLKSGASLIKNMCSSEYATFNDKQGEAADFVRSRKICASTSNVSRDLVSCFVNSAWTAVHTLDAQSMSEWVPMPVRVGLYLPTAYSLLAAARKAYGSGERFDGSLVHQAMRGGRAEVVWAMDDLVQHFDFKDEKNLLRALHNPSCLNALGAPMFDGSTELFFYLQFFRTLKCKEVLTEEQFACVEMMLQSMFQYDFRDFDPKTGKYTNTDTELPPAVLVVLEDLAKLCLLDKIPFLKRRANVNFGSAPSAETCLKPSFIANLLINWDANAVYKGSIAPIVSLLALKHNDSVVIDIPEEPEVVPLQAVRGKLGSSGPSSGAPSSLY